MAKQEKPIFSQTIEVAATPEQVWQAITDGAVTRQFWEGRRIDSTWKIGARVLLWYDAGGHEEISERGIVLESKPPQRLSYTWHVEYIDEMRDAHPSRVTFEIAESANGSTLTLTHDGFEPGSKVLEAVRGEWPATLANLKSLLDAGDEQSAA